MNLLLKITVLLLPLLGQALAGLTVFTKWDRGLEAKFTVPVNKATKGWRLKLQFEKKVDSIQAYNAKVESMKGSTVVLTNQHWNRDLQANSFLDVYLGVRYKAGQGSSKVVGASFNGQPIDASSESSESIEGVESSESSSSESIENRRG